MSAQVRCDGTAARNKNVRLAGGRWIVATWDMADGERSLGPPAAPVDQCANSQIRTSTKAGTPSNQARI